MDCMHLRYSMDIVYAICILYLYFRYMVAKYREMGSRNKKTGKLNYYDIERQNGSYSCSCPAWTFRPYADCKHIRHLREKLRD